MTMEQKCLLEESFHQELTQNIALCEAFSKFPPVQFLLLSVAKSAQGLRPSWPALN